MLQREHGSGVRTLADCAPRTQTLPLSGPQLLLVECEGWSGCAVHPWDWMRQGIGVTPWKADRWHDALDLYPPTIWGQGQRDSQTHLSRAQIPAGLRPGETKASPAFQLPFQVLYVSQTLS